MTTDSGDTVRFPSASERLLRRSKRVRLERPVDVEQHDQYEAALNCEAEVISKAIGLVEYVESSLYDVTDLPFAVRELIDEARALRQLYAAGG